jgi:uncharacterized protein (DUF486 family)
MSFARYARQREFNDRPWRTAAWVSRGVALFECLVPLCAASPVYFSFRGHA